ncbi:MAG: tyrosine-type recombinase/integrase [Syntrophothermus sp.]
MQTKTVKVGLTKKKRKKDFTYYLRYRINGKTIHENVGTSKRAAEILQSKKQSDFLLDNYSIPTEKMILSLKSIIEKFFKYKENRVQASTIIRYKKYTSPLLEFFNKNFPSVNSDISLIKKIYIEEFLNQMIDEERWENSSANDALSLYKSVFNYAVDEEYIKTNPIKKLEKFTEDQDSKEPYISLEQLSEIYKYMKPGYWVDVFQFLYNSGLRTSEIRNLKWGNIVEVSGKKYIVLTGNDSFRLMQGRTLRIPLNKIVSDILEKRNKNSVYVFNINRDEDSSKIIGKNRIYKVLVKAVKDAGIATKFTVHDFRHSFDSNLAKAGVSLYKIANLLGHSNQEVTRKYAHLQKEDLQAAVDSLEYYEKRRLESNL